MNLRIISVVTLLISYFYSIFIDLFYINSTKRSVPESLKEFEEDPKYNKWISYQKEVNRYRIIKDAISGLPLIFFIWFNFFIFVNSYTPDNYLLEITIIILLYCFIEFIVELPFSIYKTFRIEEKYGFNRTKVTTFVLDNLLSLFLECFVTIAAAIVFFLLMTYLPSYLAVIIATVLLILVILLIQFLFPYLSKVMNKFTPLEDGELKTKLMDLMNKNNFVIEGIYVVNASKRSTKENAYFTGLGKSKRIVIYDTLINNFSPDLITAIFAHELGHAKHKDNLNSFPSTILICIAEVVCLYLCASFISGFDSIEANAHNDGLMFVVYLEVMSLVASLFSFISNYFSRKREYAADTFAVKIGYGKDLEAALIKLTKSSFSYLNPHPFLEFMLWSHPSILKRLDNIKKNENKPN